MQDLPTIIKELLSLAPENSQAVFKVHSGNEMVFEYVNDVFLQLHKQLELQIDGQSLIGTELTQYFRTTLGFTDLEIEGRMNAALRAIKTNQPVKSKEISNVVKDKPLVLETVWTPVKIEAQQYLLWHSRVWSQNAKR